MARVTSKKPYTVNNPKAFSGLRIQLAALETELIGLLATSKGATGQLSSEPESGFKPLDWQLVPWREFDPALATDLSPVYLLAGGAGGGKTRLALEAMHRFCKKYPQATAVILRKDRATIANSTAYNYRSVVAADCIVSNEVKYRPSYCRFEYSNGSAVIWAGMHSPKEREDFKGIGTKGGIDFLFIEEATAFDRDDFNMALSRMRGTACKISNGEYGHPVILACNPASPAHWIYTDLILGNRAKVFTSKAVDNIYNPPDYIRQLESIGGALGKRLRDGEWVGAEKLVYQDYYSEQYGFNENGYPLGTITDQAEYMPGDGPLYWFIDDGVTGQFDPNVGYFTSGSPRAILFAQLAGDGRLKVFDEFYLGQVLSGEHLRRALSEKSYPVPSEVVYDTAAASLKLELQKQGFNLAIFAKPQIEESIKNLYAWLAPSPYTGVRRLMIHPRCKLLRFEFGNYAYDNNDKPEDKYNHGLDALRYGCWRLRSF